MNRIKERILIIFVAIVSFLIMTSIIQTLCAKEIELNSAPAPDPEVRDFSIKQFEYQVTITPSGKVEPDQIIYPLIGSNLTFTNSYSDRILLNFDGVEFLLGSRQSVTFNFNKKDQIIFNIQFPNNKFETYFSGVVVK